MERYLAACLVKKQDIPANSKIGRICIAYRNDTHAIDTFFDLCKDHFEAAKRDPNHPPLTIAWPNIKRTTAMSVAQAMETKLRHMRDEVPYTVSWWYTTASDGHRDEALYGISHIGLYQISGIDDEV